MGGSPKKSRINDCKKPFRCSDRIRHAGERADDLLAVEIEARQGKQKQ